MVGILPFMGLPPSVQPYTQPAALYGFIVGFVVYMVLAKAGLQPRSAEGFPGLEVVSRRPTAAA